MTISIRELGLADEAMIGELLDAIRPGWADALAPGASGPRAFVADARSLAVGPPGPRCSTTDISGSTAGN